MRDVLKALASSMAWVLVIIGCLAFFMAPVGHFTTREEYGFWVPWGISATSVILALVVIKLRQRME